MVFEVQGGIDRSAFLALALPTARSCRGHTSACAVNWGLGSPGPCLPIPAKKNQ